MSWSLGEIKSLTIKACRGAGFEWGVAEEAGYAVTWLEARGLPGGAALSAYLSARVSDQYEHSAAACPLNAGTRVMDQQLAHPSELGHIIQPLLIVPFLAAYAEQACQLLWRAGVSQSVKSSTPTGERDVAIHIARDGICVSPSEHPLLVNSAFCSTDFSENRNWVSASITRLADENAEVVDALNHLANKTYAPATEHSRLTGAGAGVSDND